MTDKTAHHLHTLSYPARGKDGTLYTVLVYGAERSDHTWEGWLEFHPKDASSPILRTKQETSQPNRSTLDYWAGGLELVYLQGALERATEVADVAPRASASQSMSQNVSPARTEVGDAPRP